MKLKIAHLYPELLNLYGDMGNIVSLKKRAEWRSIEVEVKEYSIDEKINFDDIDILFLGGGSDKEQLVVCNKLKDYKEEISKYVENNGVIIASCGGFELLGEYYRINGEVIDALNILDFYTEYENTRLIDDVVIETDFLDRPVVGFENHGGRIFIKENKPLGKVVYGNGNNGKDGMEGIIYKNLFGTYLHGPLLPKNPHLCDYILKKALQNKYGEAELQELDDSIEIAANDYIVNRFCN